MTENALLPQLKAHRKPVKGIGHAVARYLFTGYALRGAGDNASLFHDATEDYRGRPYTRLGRARWRRLTRRWLALAIPALLLLPTVVGLLPLAVLVSYLLALSTSTLGYGGYLLARWWPDRQITKEYVRPAAQVLCQRLNVRYVRRDAGKLIELPPGYGRATDQDVAVAVRVNMPGVVTLDDAQKKKLVQALANKLGVDEAQGVWKEVGVRQYVDIFSAPRPPKTVTFGEVRKYMEATTVNRPFVGIGVGGKPVYIDLGQDSPHVAMSGKSGTGKSTTAMLLHAQRIAHGVGTIILDYKRWSHQWAHKMPTDRMIYAWRIQDIHDTLIRVGAELHERIAVDSEEDLEHYRTVDIMVEEINSLIKALARFWRGERRRLIREAKLAMKQEMDFNPDDLDPPTLSPAITVLHEGVGMGRQMKMHWWVYAQRLSADVFGSNTGGDIRESFDVRLMARWDKKLWAMLVDGMKYQICPSGPRGIWGVALGEDFHVLRVPYSTDSEILSWTERAPDVLGPVLGRQELSTAVRTDTKVIVQPLPLSALVDKLPGKPMTLAGLQSAAKRPGFPAIVGRGDRGAGLYDPQEVMEWRLQKVGITELTD